MRVHLGLDKDLLQRMASCTLSSVLVLKMNLYSIYAMCNRTQYNFIERLAAMSRIIPIGNK